MLIEGRLGYFDEVNGCLMLLTLFRLELPCVS
jgi:hypothetical protein